MIQAWKSHPVWVRGLKLAHMGELHLANYVAPRVGAWIETGNAQSAVQQNGSHPVWVRGLKHREDPALNMLLCRTPCGCVD